MSEQHSDCAFLEDKFAVAEVAFYIFAVLQVIAALMIATGALPINFAEQATTMQHASLTLAAVANILCFAVGYVLLARCLKRCTDLVWRIALGLFLMQIVLSAVGTVAQPGPGPVLTCCLSVAGIVSLWNGRGMVRTRAVD